MGSPSTSKHLVPIVPALQTLESTFGEGVEFRFIGDPTLDLPLRNQRIRPWTKQRQLAELHAFDIGLMPLDDSEWTRGKCAFKAIQYLAVGTPAVASPVGAAMDVVRPGLTGFLAADLKEWTDALHELVSSRELRKRFGTVGRSYVAARFSVDATLPPLLEELEGVSAGLPVRAGQAGFSGAMDHEGLR
jgi:glycosyltransferase involved in cell wall biosynthesis